jgi:hypothetical protein
MGRRMSLIAVPALVLILAGTVWAGTVDLAPSPSDLSDLDHNYAYTWGINWNVPNGETVVAASLFFNDMRNWDTFANDLYVHLLNTSSVGVTSAWDNSGGGDYFNGQGILLNQWHNLGTTAQDITYNFDASELSSLKTYLSNGYFGLGFDPDCHYYNNGVTLTIQTCKVSEPGSSLLLLGMAFVPLALSYRHWQK